MDQRGEDGFHGILKMHCRGHSVIGFIHQMDYGGETYLSGETAGEGPVPILWGGADGGVPDGPPSEAA